jgi:hypothetical protein
LWDTPLTKLIVYGRHRRYHHSHPPNPDGHERKNGTEEETSRYLHACVGRGVSRYSNPALLQPLTIQCMRRERH